MIVFRREFKTGCFESAAATSEHPAELRPTPSGVVCARVPAQQQWYYVSVTGCSSICPAHGILVQNPRSTYGQDEQTAKGTELRL